MRIAWITTGIAAHENEHRGASAIINLLKQLSIYNDLEIIVFSLYYPQTKPAFGIFKSQVYSFGKNPEPGRLEKILIWNNCIKAFEKEHKQKKFDLIHSMWSGESGYVSSRLSKKFNIPMITNINGGEAGKIKEINFGSQLKFFQRYFVSKTFRQANVIVCGSDFILSKVEEFFGNEAAKIKKVPFGVDEKLFKPSPPGSLSFRRGGELSIISIANAVPVKSHIDLFKAFKIVLRKLPGAKLICCGQDEKNVLSKMIDELGISGNVEIKGFVDYGSVPDLLRKSHLFVLNSLYESQNMAVLEAAFCGLPVVSTDVGIAPEISGNIVKTGDYNALAEKIIYVIENYDDERKKAAENLASLKERFSLDISGQKFYELYKSISFP